jgi:transposase
MLRRMLSDDQWERIAPLLRGKVGDRGRSGNDNRAFIDAVLWIARTGSPWRDLPSELGRWNSIYVRFARWSDKDVWQEIFAVLRKDADFEEVYIDSTVIRAHQHAAGAAKKRGSRHLAALGVGSAPKSTPALKD